MTIRQILHETSLAPLDIELLLSYLLRKPREYLLAHPEKKLSLAQVAKLNKLIIRRQKKEPIAYITGKKEFYGLEFEVDKNVLIPRPETELLVENVLGFIFRTRIFSPYVFSKKTNFSKNELLTVIDVGTGSGNIIISIVKNIPVKLRDNIKFFGLDISKKALEIARKNARKYKIGKFIKFVHSNLLNYFITQKKFLTSGKLIIVANLPYISPKIYQKNKNNLKYEPKKALISPKNGLKHYEELLKQIKQIFRIACFNQLESNRNKQIANHFSITIILEISPEQKKRIFKKVKRLLPLAKPFFQKDLATKTRYLKLTL